MLLKIKKKNEMHLISDKMVKFSQSLEPSFDNMVMLPRKENSSSFVFQDKGDLLQIIYVLKVNLKRMLI